LRSFLIERPKKNRKLINQYSQWGVADSLDSCMPLAKIELMLHLTGPLIHEIPPDQKSFLKDAKIEVNILSQCI